MYWIPFEIENYLEATRELTPEQHGCFILMLAQNWKGKPVPLNQEGRYRVAGAMTSSERSSTDMILLKFFVEKEDGFWNENALEIYEKQRKISKKRAKSGAAGGLKAQANARAKGQANANQSPTKPEIKPDNSPKGELSNAPDARRPKKPTLKTLISDDWQPDANFLAWLSEKHPEVSQAELAYQVGKMKNNHQANGRRYADHNAALRNWFESDFYKPGPGAAAGGGKAIVPNDQREGGIIAL